MDQPQDKYSRIVTYGTKGMKYYSGRNKLYVAIYAGTSHSPASALARSVSSRLARHRLKADVQNAKSL